MKKLKNLAFIGVLAAIISTLASCGDAEPKTLKDEQLSGFMLGGIYFANGYGGMNNVYGMLNDAGYTSKSELIKGYKEIFEFPFDASQASGIKNIFSSMWDITDKASLMTTIEDLKTRNHDYKAWDFARIVNNACMGYAAGWLNKDEVKAINAEVLPLARQKFTTWDAYFTDFEKGRLDWNKNDPQAASFKALANTITKGEKSIYNILPLNQE